jgi:methyl-accepting chemotaxis protein
MKNLKMGVKIGMGFGFLILITCFLGGLTIWDMGKIKTGAQLIDNEYIPEVTVSNEIERNSLQTMFEIRGYALSGEKEYLEEGRKHMEDVKKSVLNAKDLAGSSIHLTKLREAVERVDARVSEYESLLNETVQRNEGIEQNRKSLDESAAKYMKNCEEFLTVQNEQFKKDLTDRQAKLRLVTQLVDIGSETRVLNFKSQAAQDPYLMENAIRKIGELEPVLADLKKITRDDEDIKRIETTESAAKNYKNAMNDYLNEHRKGTEAASNKLETYRKLMDESAAGYMKNCNEFMEGQHQKLTKDLTERHTKIALVNQITDIGNLTRIMAFKSQALREPQMIQDAMKNFDQMAVLFTELKSITRLAENLRDIEEIKEAANAYKSAMAQLFDNWTALNKQSKQREKVAYDVLKDAQETAAKGMERMTSTAEESARAIAASSNTMVIGLIFAIIIGLAAAWFITRSIVEPMKLGLEFAKKVSQGDLTARIEVNQKDEIGVLAAALRDMVSKLRLVVDRVKTSANNVASGSRELSSGAQQLNTSSEEISQGASEQASSVEEVSSSMEQMASNIRQNADNAMQTEKIAKKASEDAKGSGKAVEETVNAMRQIVQKISIIEDISRQTNLLALNAAIEAARAGEYGRGFAVVASEVRTLAENSKTAAIEINELAQANMGISEKASAMIIQLVPDIEKTADLVQEISAACNEQDTVATQVNKAVQQLDIVIQRNVAASEEMASASEQMAATSEELTGQSDSLRQAMKFFKIEDSGERFWQSDKTNWKHDTQMQKLGKKGARRKAEKNAEDTGDTEDMSSGFSDSSDTGYNIDMDSFSKDEDGFEKY